MAFPQPIVLAPLLLVFSTLGCFDHAPEALGRTRSGPGATVRFELAHKPLPAIPLPNDTATWPDPSSRTGLRINASLIAPTALERKARAGFNAMEGWGTFAPITVAFDVPGAYEGFTGPALNLPNLRARHQGNDYDFADDAVYLVNLRTGVPMVLDVGAGNFSLTLKKLDKYWPNDTRASERNLVFETIDETQGGAITEYAPQYDSDFDGVLDRPNFENAAACPDPDPVCDDDAPGNAAYHSQECYETRRQRDRCVTDNLLTWYERESDTLIVRPLLPLDEMTPYAVVLTDRLIDSRGNAVKSPFDRIYHPAQEEAAEQVRDFINTASLSSYYGDLSGSGLQRIGFVWKFTTQPTVDDMKRLRDGLYGQGPFARWNEQYAPTIELQRAVGLVSGLAEGATDPSGWNGNHEQGLAAGCPDKSKNLYTVSYPGMRDKMRLLLQDGFDLRPGPATEQLMRRFDSVSHMVVGTFKVPYLLDGGPASTDPNAAFRVNFKTGEAAEWEDTVQFWMVVPKATSEHQQPFDVNIFGHGYGSHFVELLLYAGNMAEHGIATISINAMGHGLVFQEQSEELAAGAALGGSCNAPFLDALRGGRARDLNNDGQGDSGGDFWSSYLFHTRDAVRQSVLDHIQLVRIMRAWGTSAGAMDCRNDARDPAVSPCEVGGSGKLTLAGDFDGDGTVDAGGQNAKYATWGESLGGILSGVHGAIDAFVTTTVPGSGGGGLVDIGVRSFQGGVLEAVLLRTWGPLLVSVPATERESCHALSKEEDHCTTCAEGELSLRWVVPDVNDTGEVEVACLPTTSLSESTVRVVNQESGEMACARTELDGRMRIGIAASIGDGIRIEVYEGKDVVESYAGCKLASGAVLRLAVENWSGGHHPQDAINLTDTDTCRQPSCASFQGRFFGEKTPLTAPAEGLGHIRQTPALRRFLGLAQAALEPGDPINFAPYYLLKSMPDPFGKTPEPHAVLTLNTVGDQNVPLNSGIAFARATGAVPFLRPDQAERFPHYRDFVTPQELYDDLGSRTPNQELIDRGVIEGITALARHPASQTCQSSQNAAPLNATFLDADGATLSCYPSGCSEQTESDKKTRLCYSDQRCDSEQGQCVPRLLGWRTCTEALWDSDDLDEGEQLYHEQSSPVPHRLARLSDSAQRRSLEEIWAPRLSGKPGSDDATGWHPQAAPGGRLTAMLNGYLVPEGKHTFENGEPCQAFDMNSYLNNLVARFFQSDGTDLYYLSHPASHQCLSSAEPSCSYSR